MAEPSKSNRELDRDRSEDATGMSDENIAGRLSDEDVDEFEDTEDLEEEDDTLEESDR